MCGPLFFCLCAREEQGKGGGYSGNKTIRWVCKPYFARDRAVPTDADTEWVQSGNNGNKRSDPDAVPTCSLRFSGVVGTHKPSNGEC